MNRNQYHTPKDQNDPPYRKKTYYYRSLQKLAQNHYPKTEKGVNERLDEYYKIVDEYDVIPSLETMAIAFGVTVSTMKRWLNGGQGSSQFTPEAMSALILAYQSIQAELSDELVDGGVNTPGAIFVLKNNHGYKDVQQVEIAPKEPEEHLDVKMLEQKYTDVLDE